MNKATLLKEIQSRAGCKALQKTQSTKTLVGLYNAKEAEIDSDDELPWITLCEDHGSICSHATRKIAQQFLSHPEDWCEDCQEK